MKPKTILLIIFYTLMVFRVCGQQPGREIQINIDTLLNARPVTTLTHGKLVTWSKGIDGDGQGDGYLTMAAALFNKDKDPHALPDHPGIEATPEHPSITLHYKNSAGTGYQAHFVSGEGSFGFYVPPKRYMGMYLSLTSAEGGSQLQIELTYKDGVAVKDFWLPDYYNDIIARDTSLSYVVHDLAKWDKKNNMAERNHHNIDALNIYPDPRRVLLHIKVKKGTAGYLLFWAATGVPVK
ncbi:hypothetical protein SAMN05428975_4665 [Mucilaginibacter sp. OK268]|uniref:hypothetical protein n=1 Tax=Mucilaginibacter sp. OK268 TaxID=1881048 RepID=UPI0008849ABE|nr:hypothetical protein [Mucilaginibacter sp. OK268]SDP98223.1 hypothetical protein SAMN05428975_4665 [Mucilaginibacter sp. OK268]